MGTGPMIKKALDPTGVAPAPSSEENPMSAAPALAPVDPEASAERLMPSMEERMRPAGRTPDRVPVAPPSSPVPTAENAAAELEKAADLARRRIKGRSATILTSGVGIADDPSVSRRVLLGT
jgi:hypothetical protein